MSSLQSDDVVIRKTYTDGRVLTSYQLTGATEQVNLKILLVIYVRI